MIVKKERTIVDENEYVTLNREIDSNPLSDVSWYVGSELLKSEWSVKNATLTIKKALCTNTQNYTLVASNTVEINVTALVELIVNCEYNAFFKKMNTTCNNLTQKSVFLFSISKHFALVQLDYMPRTDNQRVVLTLYFGVLCFNVLCSFSAC